MALKATPAQAKQVHRLVKSGCCNCWHGDCLLLDDGKSHKCVQLISWYAIYCNYFLNTVLPADKELYNAICKNNHQI